MEAFVITMRQFSPQEVLIKENEPGESAYVIEKGRVEISKELHGIKTHIAFLEAGDTFGEMSMIDERLRSATVTALEETLVRELHRDDFYSHMKEDPDSVIKILKRIFERLREANLQLALNNPARNEARVSLPVEQSVASPTELPKVNSGSYFIEGLTPKAIEAISQNPFNFKSFPFNIGRKSKDPMVSNHLEIQDQAPLQISRHHVSIVRVGDKIGVVDRGSQLGARIDETRIGGKFNPGPVFFKGKSGTLVLGPDSSPYQFKITLAE
jgi:Cyclic nucleotide-binding domain/FHA domain